jgi:hypothetical protein
MLRARGREADDGGTGARMEDERRSSNPSNRKGKTRGARSALALVPRALEQLPLLVLPHLLAPLLDDASHQDAPTARESARARR